MAHKTCLLFPCWQQICSLLLAFANSLDPEQDLSSSESKLFNTLIVYLKEFYKIVNFEQSQQSIPIWVQTVCKGYQQLTKVATSKERVYKLNCIFKINCV